MKPTSVLFYSVSLLLTACASPSRIEVPDMLKPGPNESLAMIVPAKGVQIYECRAKKDSTGFEWAFVAPEAELFDAHGNTIGRHGADAPVAGAIPWLLLTTKSTGPAGSFSNVSSIQRVNTAGGVAPTAGCARNSAGTTARVSYAADYYLFTNR